jgi:hypothetical protein
MRWALRESQDEKGSFLYAPSGILEKRSSPGDFAKFRTLKRSMGGFGSGRSGGRLTTG